MFKTILFDLDGTITASAEGITKSVQYALDKFKIVESDLDKLLCFVGPPLKEQFMRFAGLSEEDALKAVVYYRERYAAKGIFENKPYQGIEEMLCKLKEKGYILAIASSKPTYFVKQITDYFSITQYFQAIVGSEMNGTRSRKDAVIKEAMHQLGIAKGTQQVVMVGDKEHDVYGAHQTGMPCIGAAYGYGGREELEHAGADFIVGNVAELQQLLMLGGVEQIPLKKKVHPIAAIWSVLYPIGIHFLASLVASFAVGIVLSIFYMSTGQAENFIDAINDTMLLSVGIGNLLAIPFLLWCMARDKRQEGVQLAKTDKSVVEMVLTVIWLGALGLTTNMAIGMLGLFELFPEYGKIQETMMDTQPFFLNLMAIGIFAPIAEELVFRGLVFKRLNNYLNVGWGIAISAILFGLYHGNMVQFLYATIVGAAFAWMYHRTNTIIIPILGHMAVNIMSVFIMEFYENQVFIITYGLVILLSIGITIGGFIYFIIKKEKGEVFRRQ